MSLKKPNVMEQDVSEVPRISIGDCTLEMDEEFTYLSSKMSSNLSLEAEIGKRTSKAASAISRLSKRVWENDKLTTKTDILVYNVCLLSTLLYERETRTGYV